VGGGSRLPAMTLEPVDLISYLRRRVFGLPVGVENGFGVLSLIARRQPRSGAARSRADVGLGGVGLVFSGLSRRLVIHAPSLPHASGSQHFAPVGRGSAPHQRRLWPRPPARATSSSRSGTSTTRSSPPFQGSLTTTRGKVSYPLRRAQRTDEWIMTSPCSPGRSTAQHVEKIRTSARVSSCVPTVRPAYA
jgi:hypothetical protein